MEDLIFIYSIFLTIFGLCIGSFLNVVIYRLPRGKNIVYRSECIKCGHKIRWFENIPVISYLFLLGKCSNCKERISLRYPFVEILLGFAAFMLAPSKLSIHEFTLFLFYFSCFSIFVAHFFIDLEHQILPDSLNLILLALILPYVLINHNYTHWLFGGLLGFLFPLSVTWVFYKLKGQVGLGGGDIKLYGILGLYLGFRGILENIFYSCFAGATVGIILILFGIMKKDNPIPFGPFIILISIFQIYFKDFWPPISLF